MLYNEKALRLCIRKAFSLTEADTRRQNILTVQWNYGIIDTSAG